MAEKATQEQLNQLSEQLNTLNNKLNVQADRLNTLERHLARHLNEGPDSSPFFIDSQQTAIDPRAKLGSSLGNSGTHLAKLATICFILVIALILRTLTDKEIIGFAAGSKIGTAYAFFLIALGWRMLRKKQLLAPIFPICGALLMFTLVIETHARFEVYTSITAYTILLFTMLPLVIMGRQHQLSFFHGVGLIGATFTAIALDFPEPIYTQLSIFLIAANIISFSSEHQKKRRSQIALYALTAVFWFLWTAKLHVPLAKGLAINPKLGLQWFLPITLFTAAIFSAFTGYASFRKGKSLSMFDLILPTTNVLWFFTVCALVFLYWQKNGQLFGYGGILISIGHYIIAWRIFKSTKQSHAAISSYIFAGSVLLMMSTITTSLYLTGTIMPALLLLSMTAIALCKFAITCERSGTRLTSYLLQGAITLTGIGFVELAPGAQNPAISLFMGSILVLISGYHYFWARKRPLSCSTGFLSELDPKDYLAVMVLIATLGNLFGILQLGAYRLLIPNVSDPINSLLGVQSILINIGVICLMTFGLMKRNREILYTAIGIFVIGALKTLGYDLFKIQGIPLVLSVFSFGVVAAVGSFVMNRWSRIQSTEFTQSA